MPCGVAHSSRDPGGQRAQDSPTLKTTHTRVAHPSPLCTHLCVQTAEVSLNHTWHGRSTTLAKHPAGVAQRLSL